jgi:hypothetical protein
MKEWKVVDIDNAKYIGILELEDHEDAGVFEIVQTEDKLVFGSSCNIGLLQSGYMDIDDCFSLDENLQALAEQLEMYYDGERDLELVYSDRM